MKQLFLLTTLAGIGAGLVGGCAGVKFSINFAKQDSGYQPREVTTGVVSGRSSNPKEFIEVLTYLGYEIHNKEPKSKGD